jgi:hypothetical protein
MSHFAATTGLAFALLAGAAHAEPIDGSWCDAAGQRLTIDGPAVVTPGGRAILGENNRRLFNYVVPGGEANFGATMQLRLLNLNTMHSRAGADAKPDTWHRCPAPAG